MVVTCMQEKGDDEVHGVHLHAEEGEDQVQLSLDIPDSSHLSVGFWEA